MSNNEIKDANNSIAKSDEGQITISEGKMRAYMSFQPIVLPLIGELINEMVLRGRSAEEIQAATESAARSYSAFYQTFMNPQKLTGDNSQEIEHKQDGTRSENVSQTVPKNGPHIDAGSLSREEFREWIRGKLDADFAHDPHYPSAINEVCDLLQNVKQRLKPVIEGLQDPEIIRSADHASEVRQEVLFYLAVNQASDDFLNAIQQLKESHLGKYW
ncbi:hypothetical protein DNY36_21305 [Salmonella enterica subsp. diarizonae]|nr:hypothetical protein [Salmonella enterica subsp. diarizonae]ECI3628381.1 hypothetical protein [Salmonella enterica subsp. diarizonae]EDT8143981.1 hypothetical protein [Salmonella enterica subsp. diarizonae]